jgi:uncharacterized protein YeaO (DUF488 family)
MIYKVYFEFFGKRFKTEMQSDDKEAILKYLASRINIEKIDAVIDAVNDAVNDTEAFDRLMDMFGFNK